MEIRRKRWKELDSTEKDKILSRSELDISEIRSSIESIIQKVRTEGDTAVTELTRRFDGVDIPTENLLVCEAEFAEAEKQVDNQLKNAIKHAVSNVHKFHSAQVPKTMEFMEVEPGVIAGERPTPIPSCGLYVPSGRGSFPSMLYMLAVPAVLAGVPSISITTPPRKDGSVDPVSLYTARLCGVEKVYKIGGAQAIAAFAYGTETVPNVAKIIGPGSMYVAAAKQLLTGIVDVGLPAGPSESAILADYSANPYNTALDLLIEAEHGSDSSALLVTPSEQLAEEVEKYIKQIVPSLPEPRKGFVETVLSNYGGIILTDTVQEGADVINSFAPEHLLIKTEDPFDSLSLIQNAGEILLGENTPFSIANYATGPNAVLPTGGRSVTYSPVSVRDFIKYSSVIYTTKNGLNSLKKTVTEIADHEGFPAHGNAVRDRKQ